MLLQCVHVCVCMLIRIYLRVRGARSKLENKHEDCIREVTE